MEILQIGIYILKTGAVWRLDCSFALLFLWLFLACTVVSSAASHQEGHSNMGIHLSPDGVNSESFWVKFSIIWQFLKDSFTSFIFKLQHCSQITWPQPVSSHAWLSGKERERKIALVRWHFSADVSVNHVDPPEKLQHTCPTCPLLLPVESHQAVNTARITLASYRRQFVRGAELGVRTITRASAQVWLRFQEKQTFPEPHISICGICHFPFMHFIYSRPFQRKAVLWSTQSRSVQRDWQKEEPASSRRLILILRW